jgi:hypothetical protein
MCGWSAAQVNNVHYMSRIRHRPETDVTLLLPENVAITRFSYLVFPELPAYFSHGVVDPEMEHRFYSDSGQLLWSNYSLVLDAAEKKDPRIHQTDLGSFTRENPQTNFWTLRTKIRLEPGKRYLAKFAFGPTAPAGVLQFVGARIFREYELPQYGNPKSFGFPEGAEKTVSLWSSETGGDTVEARFVAQTNESTAASMQVQLIEYDPALLRAKVLSWIPYRVAVDSPQSGWLETPRMYQRYWSSASDVKKSEEHLVLIRHSGGNETHELKYRVPVGFYLLFWAALTAIAGGFSFVYRAKDRLFPAPESDGAT